MLQINSIIKPYFIIPEKRILVTEYVQGENLHNLFFKILRFSRLHPLNRTCLYNIAARLGSGLAELQEIPVQTFKTANGAPDLDAYLKKFHYLFEETAHYLELQKLFPDLITKSRDIFITFFNSEDLASSLCFTHCDFIPQNFLKVPGRRNIFTLFDFANATIGSCYFDAAHFVSSLEDFTYLRSVSKRLIHNLSETFLSSLCLSRGFNPVLLDIFRLLLQFWSTMVLLKRGLRRSAIQSLVKKNVRVRFQQNTSDLIKHIESGHGEYENLPRVKKRIQ